jgi:hypothetical protein
MRKSIKDERKYKGMTWTTRRRDVWGWGLSNKLITRRN